MGSKLLIFFHAAYHVFLAKDIEDVFALPPIAKHISPNHNLLKSVPMTSLKGAYVDITTLSFAESAKYGEFGRWPATHQYRAHFESFTHKGFEDHRECLEVKFLTMGAGDKGALYEIQPFSIGYVDGQNKAIIMLSILAMISNLVTWLFIIFSMFGTGGTW